MATPPPRTLTPAQQALFDTARDVPENAVKWIAQEYGWPGPYDAMLSTAAVGTMEATGSFEPEGGAPFRQWAFFGACYAILHEQRVERRHYANLAKLAAAAGLRFTAGYVKRFDDFNDSDAKAARMLEAFCDGAVDAMVAAVAEPPTAEATLIERDAATYTGNALRKVMSELRPEEKKLLELRFVSEEDVKAIAERKGLNYEKLLETMQKLLVRMRAKLARLGITTRPPWDPEVSGRALDGEEEEEGEGE